MNIDLDALVQQNIKNLKAYKVEDLQEGIKLHANENPYAPPEELIEAFQARLGQFALNRYPDPECRRLKQAIAQRTGRPEDHLVIGNGSDELIQLLLQIFCGPGDAIVFPDPTFAMYSLIARGMGLTPVPVPLDEHWDFKARDLLAAAETHRARLVFLSYPNNPTGNCFSRAEIQTVVEQFSGIVVLDEAYHDFARQSFISEMDAHNNLVVLRSLSKIGLAGLRVGYAVADPKVVAEINKVRLPYNSNTVSQAFAEQLLREFSPVERQIDVILKERERLAGELKDLGRLTVFPSDSNFILFRVDGDGRSLFEALMAGGVLVRDLSAHPRLNHCLRVTVGTREENDQFLAQVRKALA
ncbi:MAG: histidinol-phosphate transaminase [Nitrospinaceae bacterium]|jgi:histidinol-phosphate aminotransferase|nr:MAG: histidinol-phosphate transaminase [Nitrospinaceae bacterium]